jgi:hypothetical protein
MTPAEASLIRSFQRRAREAADALLTGRLSPVAWHNRMAALIFEHHAAAQLSGGRTQEIDRARLAATVGRQIDYLNGFTDAIERGDYRERADALAARASLYAGPLRATFAEARYPGLPGYPCDGGTECLVNCQCAWVERQGAMWWELGAAEHCPGCLTRAAQWSPWRGA